MSSENEARPVRAPRDEPGRRGTDQLLAEHIETEEAVWTELRAWQTRMEAKIDGIAAGLSKNTEVCDEIRSYQTAGRVLTNAVKWIGGIAAAAAGMIGLWAAIKALTGIHPPGPQ